MINIPFSARNRGAVAPIDNTLPETARIGLHHILIDLVDRRYIADWPVVIREVERIGRFSPGTLSSNNVEHMLVLLEWDKALDFCERLYNRLAQDVTRWSEFSQEHEIMVPVSKVQEHIANELQELFLEENLAFEFSNGQVLRKGRRNTTDQITRADFVLSDARLTACRKHFNKALAFFRNPATPDYENSVKEAVCAVEAAARALFPDGGSTLGDIVKSITGNGTGQIPKSIAATFHGVYGFRSGGDGVGHGGTTGGAATKELAEFGLAVAASQIVFLVDLSAASEPEVPF